MPGDINSFSSKLDALRAKYHVVLDERRETARQFLNCGPTGDLSETLRYEAHKTAGTAGTFGYRQLTFSAMQLCGELDKSGVEAPSHDTLMRSCAEYLTSIEEVLRSQ